MGETLKERTAKGLFWGAIGNGMMQVASLVFGIFLLRLLTSSDYGMVGVLAIFTAIAGMFAEAGFITAIINKKEVTDKDYNAVFWFSFLMGVVLYIVLFFSADLIADFYGQPELVDLSRYLFLSIIFSCLGTSAHAYYMRNMKVKERSLIQIIAIFMAGTIGVGLAYNGFGYWGIATQSIAYILLTTIGLWILCPWKPTFKIDFSPLKDMFAFSSKLLVTTLFTHINNNIFSVLLGRLYNISQVGYYTQANKWTFMGYSTISGMLNSVVQPVLRESREDAERLLKVFRKMLRFTSFISFPLMLGLALVSRELIVITVTDRWLESVLYMQILCVWGAIYPIQVLFTGLFNSLSKPYIYMWDTIVMGIIQVVVLFVASRYNIEYMLVAFVLVNLVNTFVLLMFVCKFIRLTIVNFLVDTVPFVLISLSAMAVAYYASIYFSNIFAVLAVKVVVAAVVYALIMYLTKSVIFREVLGFIFKRRVS